MGGELRSEGQRAPKLGLPKLGLPKLGLAAQKQRLTVSADETAGVRYGSATSGVGVATRPRSVQKVRKVHAFGLACGKVGGSKSKLTRPVPSTNIQTSTALKSGGKPSNKTIENGQNLRVGSILYVLKCHKQCNEQSARFRGKRAHPKMVAVIQFPNSKTPLQNNTCFPSLVGLTYSTTAKQMRYSSQPMTLYLAVARKTCSCRHRLVYARKTCF